jgi:hypothetical protein
MGGRRGTVSLTRQYRDRSVFAAALVGAILAGGSAMADTSTSYPIKIFREDEDYSSLRGKSDLPLPLALKYVTFAATDVYASFGGEIRIKLETYDHFNFGLTRGGDFTAVSERVLGHADIHIENNVRVFLQLEYSNESGRKPVERPFDKGNVDLAQGFLDVTFHPGGERWRLRLGRQEIGIGRYVTIRDGTAIRRTFDGVRLDGTIADWSFTGFAARATRSRPDDFDDEADPADFAAALVASHALPGAGGLRFDLLAMERNFKTAFYLPGPGHELRNTLGARVYGALGSFDVDAQVSHQFGHFTPHVGPRLEIDSWGAAFEGGYSLPDWPWRPRFAARFDAAEGDNNRDDGKLTTFDLPYPNLTYLTDAAIIIPRNVGDIDPFVSVQPDSTVTLTAGDQYLWRLTPNDAVYTPVISVLIPAHTSGSFVASQPYLRFLWHPINYIELQSSLVYADPGNAVRSAGGRAQTYVAESVAFRF